MRYLYTLVALLLSATALADGYKACYTGNWFANPGEGISLDVIDPERIVGQFYGYAADGRNRWYTLDAGSSGRGLMHTTTPDHSLHQVGSFSLDFIDRNTVIFVFDIDIDIDGVNYWCLSTAQCTGSRVMTRLTQPVSCD